MIRPRRHAIRKHVELSAQTENPRLLDSQLSQFTAASIHATQTHAFDPRATALTLGATTAAPVMAVDIGGDKLIASTYFAGDGALRQDGPPRVLRGTAGGGYLDLLEEMSSLAAVRLTPIGVSYAGPVQGSRVVAGINVATFLQEFRTRYEGDFARLNPRTTLVNDGEAGLLAATLEAVRRYSAVRNVIFVINGSGLNCAVWKDGAVFTTEAGHVPVIGQLNPLRQRRACGMHGATYVCVENVAASKAGIEDVWWQWRRQRASGREVASAAAQGDELARHLYENSAWVTAHVVKGTASVFGFADDWNATAVVAHGGTFQVPGYLERVRAILETDIAGRILIFATTDFSSNACLDGAAIAALSNSQLNPAKS